MNLGSFKRGKGNFPFKPVGIGLMVVGALTLLFCVPYWLWTTVLGILLLTIGFMLWRFC